MKSYLTLLFISLGLMVGSAAIAGGVYQEPDDFINQVFENKPPKPDVLWLNKELKQQIADILDHKYKGLRVRYWSQQATGRTAWILEEIGKEKPITTGIVINDGKIERVKVLVFRESRGWEVRHDFFSPINSNRLHLRKISDLISISIIFPARPFPFAQSVN